MKFTTTRTEIKPKIRLENWSISGHSNPYTPPELQSKCLSGSVYGHPRFDDGDVIVTSPIVGAGSGGVITGSGSEYELGKIDPEYALVYPGAKEQLMTILGGGNKKPELGKIRIEVKGESSDVCCTMERVCRIDTAALVEKKLTASVEKALIENGG